jgi:hypothetical protein
MRILTGLFQTDQSAAARRPKAFRIRAKECRYREREAPDILNSEE